MTDLRENLDRVAQAIEQACRRAGRDREDLELMAVSKTYPAATISAAAALGLSLFGENRVQEFAAKSAELEPLRLRSASPVRVHLIGNLQSNKASRAAEIFDGIDSVDSARLARRLHEASGKTQKRLPVLVEVKLSSEPSKHGVDPESREVAELFEVLPDLDCLDFRGLMTIAPFGGDPQQTRQCFRSLRIWQERWAAQYPSLNFDVLSMGMSGDFPLAIEEGATRIRVGTAIFGNRG